MRKEKRNAILVSLAVGLAFAAAGGTNLPMGRAAARVVDDFFTHGGVPGNRGSQALPAAGNIEAAFSPAEGADRLVLKVIASAQREIQVMAYSFTSAPVVGALLEARKRGVRVTLVADKKSNTSDDRSGKSRAALSALSTAGVDVRLTSAFAIHHDKVLVVDREHVQTGSFNYTDAAARRNSENVLVNWNNPALAKLYVQHFERNLQTAESYAPAY